MDSNGIIWCYDTEGVRISTDRNVNMKRIKLIEQERKEIGRFEDEEDNYPDIDGCDAPASIACDGGQYTN